MFEFFLRSIGNLIETVAAFLVDSVVKLQANVEQIWQRNTPNLT